MGSSETKEKREPKVFMDVRITHGENNILSSSLVVYNSNLQYHPTYITTKFPLIGEINEDNVEEVRNYINQGIKIMEKYTNKPENRTWSKEIGCIVKRIKEIYMERKRVENSSAPPTYDECEEKIPSAPPADESLK